MTTLQKTLLVLIPLVVILILFMVYVAMSFVKGDKATIHYSDIAIQGKARGSQEVNLFRESPYNELPSIQTQNLLDDWQDSQNIKQGDYVPRVVEPATVNTTTNIKESTAKTTNTNTEEEQYTTESPEDSGIWGWVPQTILRDSVSKPTESPVKQALKKYGNEAGSLIKSFTRSAGNQPDKLSAFMADYTDGPSSFAVLDLGTNYTELSQSLALLWAPSELGSTPKNLSQTYHLIGTELLKLSHVENDTDALKQIYAYNASVDNFAKEYIKLVNLFGAYGVTFTRGEGGDIFTPPSQ